MLTIEARAELITDLTADRNRYADSGQADMVAEYNRAIILEQAKLAHSLNTARPARRRPTTVRSGVLVDNLLGISINGGPGLVQD